MFYDGSISIQDHSFDNSHSIAREYHNSTHWQITIFTFSTIPPTKRNTSVTHLHNWMEANANHTLASSSVHSFGHRELLPGFQWILSGAMIAKQDTSSVYMLMLTLRCSVLRALSSHSQATSVGDDTFRLCQCTLLLECNVHLRVVSTCELARQRLCTTITYDAFAKRESEPVIIVWCTRMHVQSYGKTAMHIIMCVFRTHPICVFCLSWWSNRYYHFYGILFKLMKRFDGPLRTCNQSCRKTSRILALTVLQPAITRLLVSTCKYT